MHRCHWGGGGGGAGDMHRREEGEEPTRQGNGRE